MKWGLVCAAIAVSLTLAGSYLAADSSQGAANDLIEQLEEVAAPRDLVRLYKQTFVRANAEQLRRLVADPNCGVCLAAGWERVLRTLPKSRQKQSVKPDVLAVARFLGLVEGRTQVPVPALWEAAVLSIDSYGRQSVWPSLFDLDYGLDDDDDAEDDEDVDVATKPSWETDNLDHTRLATVRRDGDRWVVTLEKETWFLPREDFPDMGDEASVLLTNKVAYVAGHDWPALPYHLHAIDRATAAIVWSTEVWSDGGFITAGSGGGWHRVSLHYDRGRLTVYGAAVNTVYIEAFDARTGKNLYRFGTSYFQEK